MSDDLQQEQEATIKVEVAHPRSAQYERAREKRILSMRVMIGVATEEIPGTHYRVIVKSPAVVWPRASFKGFVGLVILASLALFLRAFRRRTHAAGITK